MLLDNKTRSNENDQFRVFDLITWFVVTSEK
jgi:hypothetical protein